MKNFMNLLLGTIGNFIGGVTIVAMIMISLVSGVIEVKVPYYITDQGELLNVCSNRDYESCTKEYIDLNIGAEKLVLEVIDIIDNN